jgi:hypothetical protein
VSARKRRICSSVSTWLSAWGVEHEPHPGLLAQDAREMPGALGEGPPLVLIELGRLELAAVGQVAVHGRQEHYVPGAERGGQPRDLEQLGLDGPELRTPVQRAADGAAG